MFIVYGADANGAGGTVRSFGRRSSGLLGEVDTSTRGLSEGTYAKDLEYWKTKKGDVRFVRIPASDAAVECSADSFVSKWLYTLPKYKGWAIPTSSHLTMNSNTAAQAIADHVVGKHVEAPPGWHPRVENSGLGLIEFSQ